MIVQINTNTYEAAEIRQTDDVTYDEQELLGNVLHAVTWYLGRKIYMAEDKRADDNFTRNLLIGYLDQVIDDMVLTNI